ncbi:MAG: hypothetical protein ABI723_08250 [Bacteroidia bacterium]
MKNLKTLLLLSTIFSQVLQAQTLTLTPGSEAATQLVKKSEYQSFTSGSDRYFITKAYKDAFMHYSLLSYDARGQVTYNGELKIKGGVFNNTFGIDDVLPLGNKVYAMVEHLDKAAGKNTLLARVFDAPGSISEKETEVMNIPFEKLMNSGFNFSVVSPDKNTLAVIGEMPFDKEQPAKFKVVLFDKDFKKTAEGEINLPGENTKKKSMTAYVSNNGVVYLLKETFTNKGEIVLGVYQFNPAKGNDVKEYIIEVTPPDQIYSYTCEVNPNNELIVIGTYYKRQALTVGGTLTSGVFYFTNKGLSEKLFKTFPLEAPIENLTARKIFVNDNTIFLTAEQYREETEKQAPGYMSFDYNYNYTHKNDYVIGMNDDGTKKFQIELAKDFTVRNFDRQFYSGYFICNGKLTVVYNDQTKKYMPSDSYYGYQIPLLVQITNDGLMQSPVIFKDNLKLERSFILYPSLGVQDANNQVALLMGNGAYMKILTIKIE